MSVIVRFAPSPTGMLHIGGARTALFNYLFAKKMNGKFLLRIEDTDKQRNSKEAIDAILNGLKWLGLEYDDEIVFQSSRQERHIEIAKKMIENGTAYYAYDTQEELEIAKSEAQKSGKFYKYDGTKWKNKIAKIPENINPVIRLNVPNGKIEFNDIIRGKLEFNNHTLDDLILLRSDGTPTYMLAVVVDDIDMKITHIIRGEDHISNTPKQILIYKAIGAKIPEFAHIPLIYDISGQKLSKRKGSVATEEYRENGYLNKAIFNYLLHLGWNDGTENEIFSKQGAIDAFDINKIGKSPSRFDFDKLNNINLHYIKNLNNNDFLKNLNYFINKHTNRDLNTKEISRFENLLDELRKINNFVKISDAFLPFLENFEYKIEEKSKNLIKNNINIINLLIEFFQNTKNINIKNEFDEFLTKNNLKIKDVGSIFRSCIVGKIDSFGIFKLIEVFSIDEILIRLIKIKNQQK